MTITANSGPFISYGTVVSASGATMEYNEHRGPSLADLGDGLLDPRQQYNYGYQPGQGSSQVTFGFWGLQGIVDFVPTTISTNNITALSSPSSNGTVALTLTTSQSSGTGILASFVPPEGGAPIANLLYIDAPCGGSSNAGQAFGQAGSIQIWNPASVCGRGITINLSSNLDAGSWTIAGRDVYGFKVTESITAGSTTLKSKKTYKYISSIMPATTTVSTGVTVGTQDLYGFPLRADTPAYLTIWAGPSSAATLITTSTAANHVFAVTSAASNTTGDVRGTWASSVASNSTAAAPIRIQIFVTPSVTNLQGITATSYTGLFGLTQFSSV